MATPIPENHALFALDVVALATRGTIARRASETASSIGTDSRTIRSGSLFVALRGLSHDGHRFVELAAQRGASIAVVERGFANQLSRLELFNLSIVVVDDTLVALGDLARAYLDAWRLAPGHRVLAITGSAGKTTTKEIAANLLETVAKTHRTAGNLNNRVGVPFVVLGLLPEHRFAVLEMGMSLPGELDAIVSFARPDVALVTNVGLAHAEGVGGPEGIMQEKGAVYRALEPSGVAIVNADDPLVKRAANGTRAGRVITFGQSADADYRLVTREALVTGGSSLTIACPSRTITLHLPLAGAAAAIDLVAALASVEALSGELQSVAQMNEGLSDVRVHGRATLKRLRGDILVLDDTYNANPASMRAAFDTLSEIAGSRRAVVVLGEMKELGDHAEREHDELGTALAKARVAVAIGCGGLIERTLRRASRENSSMEPVFAQDTGEAVEQVLRHVRPSDVVLVKGSRSVGAERVVAALTEAWPEHAFSESSVPG